MSEQQQPAAAQGNYSTLVMKSLYARRIKPRCLDCNCIGWAKFELIQMPVVSTVLAGGMLLDAVFVCRRCGSQKRFNLNVLGVQINVQQPEASAPTDETPAMGEQESADNT